MRPSQGGSARGVSELLLRPTDREIQLSVRMVDRFDEFNLLAEHADASPLIPFLGYYPRNDPLVTAPPANESE